MATPKIRKQVYWQEDERVDVPDATAQQTFARLRSQDIVQFLAGRAPRVGDTGRTWMPYAIWALNGSGITFEPTIDNRIKIALGMRLALTGGDSDDGGDLIEVGEETILNNYCPSALFPLLLLMARVSSSLVDGDSDDRVFYKTADGTEETRNVPTTQRRGIDWVAIDATNPVIIKVYENQGYQWVAELDYNGGAHQVSEWYYVFPESEVGGGALVESVLAAVWGLKRGLEAAYGGGKDWTDTPDNTLEDDELHAADLFASTRLIVGALNAGPTGNRSMLLAYDPPLNGLGGGAFYGWKTGTAYSAAAQYEFLRWWRDQALAGVNDRKVLEVVGPSGHGDVAVGDSVDVQFGGSHHALRATKQADGIRRITYRNSHAGTSGMAMREDGLLEWLGGRLIDRDIPLAWAVADPWSVGTRVEVAHNGTPGGKVLRVGASGIGDEILLGADVAGGGVVETIGTVWTQIVENATWAQVYLKEANDPDKRLVAILTPVTGGRDAFFRWSNGSRQRIAHDAGAPTGDAVYFVSGTESLEANISGGAAVDSYSGGENALNALGWVTWRPVSTYRYLSIPTSVLPADLWLQIPKAYLEGTTTRTNQVYSVTSKVTNNATGHAVRMMLYEYDGVNPPASVGDDGAGNDYVEWTAGEDSEKVIYLNEGVATAGAALFVFWRANGPNDVSSSIYIKKCCAQILPVTSPE